VLSIGPKNEGEILLFRAHGFRHVTGADLFSYSPFIKTMDMHHMTFPDNSFDIVNSGWVVRYSYDIAQCAREMVRVAAPGSLMSIAFSGHAEEKDPSPGIGAPLHGGLDELLRHFGPHVGHVYWRLEDHNTDESKVPEHTHSVIFRVKK
jgi:ubiquinone/menaquinone biosynthesis C-methylase UbiE